MSELGNIKVTFDAETSKAIDQLSKLKKAFKDSAKEAEDSGSSIDRALSKTVGINAAIGIAKEAAAAFGALYSAMKEAAAVTEIQSVFENAGHSITLLREATHGLISDIDLMKQANYADSLGLSEQAFAQLANVADAAAGKIGADSKEMFEDLIKGSAGAKAKLLEQIGVTIDATQANLDYARALKEQDTTGQYASLTVKDIAGAMGKEATNAAYLEAVLKKTTGITEKAGDANGEAADQFDRLEASASNLKKALSELVDGSGLIGWLANVVDGLARAADAMGKMPGMAMRVSKLLIPGSGMVTGDSAAKIMADLQEASYNTGEGMTYQAGRTDASGKVIGGGLTTENKKVGLSSEQLAEASRKKQEEAANLALEAAKRHTAELKELDDKWKAMNKAAEKSNKEWAESEAAVNAMDAAADAAAKDLEDMAAGAENSTRVNAAMATQAALATAALAGLEGAASLATSAIDVRNAGQTPEGKFNGDATGAIAGVIGVIGTVLGSLAGAPELGVIIGAVGSVFASLAGSLQPAIEMVGKLGAALATASPAIEKLFVSFMPLADALASFVVVMVAVYSALANAIIPIFDALVMILVPVVAVIAALETAFLIAANALSFITKGIEVFFTSLSQFGQIFTGVESATGGLQETMLALNDIVVGVGQYFLQFVYLLANVMNGISSAVQQFFAPLADAFAPIKVALEQLWNSLSGVGFSILATAFDLLVQALIPVIAFFSPFVDMLSMVVSTLVIWNNALVDLIRDIPGFEDFGVRVNIDQLHPEVPIIADNTKATTANTKATNNLAREMRNMPAGFKAAIATFNATTGGLTPREASLAAANLGPASGMNPRLNFRFRI